MNLFIVLKEGKIAGPYATVAAAKGAGAVTLNYGMFLNTVVNFLIVASSTYPSPSTDPRPLSASSLPWIVGGKKGRGPMRL